MSTQPAFSSRKKYGARQEARETFGAKHRCVLYVLAQGRVLVEMLGQVEIYLGRVRPFVAVFEILESS
jgi:hypothetical protein